MWMDDPWWRFRSNNHCSRCVIVIVVVIVLIKKVLVYFIFPLKNFGLRYSLQASWYDVLGIHYKHLGVMCWVLFTSTLVWCVGYSLQAP